MMKCKGINAVVALGVFLGACNSDRSSEISSLSRSVIADTSEFLPYGVSIPENVILTKSPQPYNPKRHGPPIANTMPDENLANRRGFRLPRYPANHGRKDPEPGNGDSGISLFLTGINARNDAQYDLTIPYRSTLEDATIYAPTHLPQPASCIEATTVHRTENDVTAHHYHGFWEWCNGVENFRVMEGMTSTWKSKYTRLYAGYGGGTAEPAFYVEVHSETPANPIGGCWLGMLYNFNSGVWEQKLRSCGTSPLPSRGFNNGWTMWESYGLANHGLCPNLASIKASFIRKQGADFSWLDLDFSDGTRFEPGSCFVNGNYTFTWPVAGEWQGHTPN